MAAKGSLVILLALVILTAPAVYGHTMGIRVKNASNENEEIA